MVEKRRVFGPFARSEAPSAEDGSRSIAKRPRARSTIQRSRSTKKRQPPRPKQAPRRPSVLVVEDNPATRRVVRLSLEQQGFHVLEAPDGRTALELMELERPQVVLQDLMLPDMDGFDLVSNLRARAGNSKVSILAFSGFVATPDAERMRLAGFDDVLTKPIDGARLSSILEAHLLLTAPTPDRFGEGRRVVVAHQDPLQLRVTRLRLERLGFRVSSASNGTQALETARRVKPDVLIADVMMPRLDGFGLSLLLRQEPELRALTIVLVSSEAVGDADRGHARRSGANRLVQRTPDLKELTQALRASTLAPDEPPLVMPEALLGLEQERSQRLLRQLERQVALNKQVSGRCAALAAELTVLSGISETVIRSGDLEAALDEALAICLDAGGVSMGALYLLEPDATFRVRTAGTPDGAQLRTFFGHEDVLHWIVNGGTPVEIPSRDLPTDLSIEILTKSGATNVLVAPLTWRERPLGALVLLARNRELDPENWRAFAQGVANQITQALALANAFETKERAEKDARGQASMLRVVLEATNEGVILADRDGKFLLWNGAAETLSGSPAKDLPVSEWGSSFGVYRDERLTPLLSEELPLVRAMRGENVEPVDVYVRPPGGDAPRWLRVSGKPVAPAEGDAAAVVVFQDVTDQRRRQTQLAASHSLISLGLVTTSVAREITNPLSAVLSNLELAIGELQELSRRQPLNKALSDELRDALAGAERLRHVATDLRLFSPSEETSSPVDVRRVLDAALRLTQSEVRQRGRVNERYAAVPPVIANEARLGHVFLNLLLNAAHNLPEGPSESNEIRVSTRLEPGDRVAISFSYATPAAGSSETTAPGTPWADTSALISACRASIASFGGELTWTRWDEDEHVIRVSLPVAPSTGD